MLQTLLSRISEELRFPFPAKEFLPPAGDALWTGLSRETKRVIEEEGRRALGEEIPSLPATLYADFFRTGNRNRFEKPFFARRTNLIRLVKAYCLNGEGVLLDRIIDYADAICGEWTWVVPAHNWPLDNPFPPAEPPRVDLFAANTSSLLALTVHLLREPLEREAGRLTERIRKECRRRCLIPFMENDDHWWMGYLPEYRDRVLNNWNPWITDNFLHTLFLLEEDRTFLQRGVSRAAEILNHYLDSLPSDGGCDEGPSYWDHAVGSLFDCLEILDRGAGGDTGLLTDHFLKEAASYIYRTHITGDYFINYADCIGRLNHMPGGLMYRMGEAMGDGSLKALASAFRAPAEEGDFPELNAFSPHRQIRDLTVLWPEEAPVLSPPGRDCFPQTQVGIVRTEKFTFSCKGGHNDESHNHNDVGQFVLYGRGAPFLVDPGVGDYTRETFSDKRYGIWTMQSGWHNLPRINGYDQLPGREYRCGRFDFGDDRCLLDLREAYPAGGELDFWYREFRWADRELILRDSWRFTGSNRDVLWNFLSLEEPQNRGDGISLTNPAGECLTVRTGGFTPHWLRDYLPFPGEDGKMGAWKREGIWRFQLRSREPLDREGSVEIGFTIE